jgi:hypothetical protein
MVSKYYVTIYKVIEKFEVETLAPNGIKAKEFALDAVEQGLLKVKKPDCRFIAIDFEIKERQKEGRN